MDLDADVGSFFAHYLVDKFRTRFGATAACQIEDWDGHDEERPSLATGGSGSNLLIEFKPNEAAWAAEFDKLSRRYWCQRLGDVPSMERLADVCHFVAWDTEDLARVGALLAFYSQACRPRLMLHSREARANSQPHAIFVHAVLERQIGASDSGFQEYLRFVTPLVTHATAQSPDPDQRILWVHLWDGCLRGYWLKDFAVFSQLGEWMSKR